MKVAGVGRLTRDCEVKDINEKSIIVKFPIACDRAGDRDETDFFDCFLFLPKEAKLPDYLKKGQLVFISGSLQQDRWETKDGGKRSKVVIKIDDLKLLGGNGKKSKSPEPEEPEEIDDFDF